MLYFQDGEGTNYVGEVLTTTAVQVWREVLAHVIDTRQKIRHIYTHTHVHIYRWCSSYYLYSVYIKVALCSFGRRFLNRRIKIFDMDPLNKLNTPTSYFFTLFICGGPCQLSRFKQRLDCLRTACLFSHGKRKRSGFILLLTNIVNNTINLNLKKKYYNCYLSHQSQIFI